MIAILEAKRASLLSREHWMNNVLAGVIVGVVALLLAMAFAIASGVKFEQGIYVAIVAGGLHAAWPLRFYQCYCPHCYQYSQWRE